MTLRPKSRKTPQLKRTPLGAMLEAAIDRKRHTRQFASQVMRVSPTSVSNWIEHGRRPLLCQVPALASYLDLTVTEAEKLRAKKKGAK